MPAIEPTIQKALEFLPPSVRADYAGAAFIKAQAVTDLAEADQVRAIAGHCRYLWKRDRQACSNPTTAPISDPNTAAPDESAELADSIRTLNPEDRNIVLMILAGNTRDEISGKIRVSRRTIARRLRRLAEVLI